MRLMLHIFRKDVRRLWLEIAVTLVMLAALARWDCYPSDNISAAMAGCLNLLLPAAWVFLVVLLIHGEPLVGDRQFWITRPYRWPALLGAKALFALLFVHLAYFLAHAAILLARGFPAWEYFPQLLWKQVGLAVALTVPALGLAAVVRNLAQFALASVTLIAGAVVVGRLEPSLTRLIPVDEVRHDLAWLGLAAAAATLILIQYMRRRTALSRTVGIAAVLVVGALFSFVPRADSLALASVFSPAPAQLSMRFSPSQQRPPSPLDWPPSTSVTVALPLAISGIPKGLIVDSEALDFEIVEPNGHGYSTETRLSRGFEAAVLEAQVWFREPASSWLVLTIDSSLYDRVSRESVKVRGRFAVTFYRPGVPAWMPVEATTPIPGVGRCSTQLLDEPFAMVRVICESPSRIPLHTNIRLVQPTTGLRWWPRGLLRDGLMSGFHPMATWLSPLYRRQVFYEITEEPGKGHDSWLVPRDALPNARLTVTADHAAGSAVLPCEISGVRLGDFMVKPSRRPGDGKGTT